jgi:PAS domain S-box-containing protein
MHRSQRKTGTSASGVLVAASQAAAYSWSALFFGRPAEGFARWSSTVGRYVVAVLLIAVALAASKAAVTFLHIEPFVSLFLCAIMVAAWFGGFGPGLLAIAVGFLAFDYYLVPPVNSLTFDPKQLTRLGLFLAVALFVNWLSASQRTAARSLRRSRDELLAALEDQRKIEARLLHSETYLAEAQRLSETGSIGWNIAAGELIWSAETFRIFQCDRAIKPSVDLLIHRVHPEDRDFVRRTMELASRDGNDFDHEYRLLMPDGAVKHVRAVARASRDETGGVELVGAVMDVTATRRAGEELRHSEQRFRDFAETASDWFWEAGPDHRLVSVSRKPSAVSGNAGVGMTIWEAASDVEEESEKWQLHRATLDERQSFRDFRFRSMKADGTPVYLAASGKPVFDSAGNFLGYRGVASDISAMVRAEQAEAALQEAQANLAHATRVTTLGELAASIAHEVNQPLAAIMANAEACLRWLSRSSPNVDAARRSVEWIINDSSRAAEVVGRVRALAAKKGGERTSLDINDVINEVRALVQRQLSDNRVLLRVELAPVGLTVHADRVQLQQVIINLVMNGIEAMQLVTDRPRELTIRSRQNHANQVLVMVEDRGVGFSSVGNTERLFDAFFTTKSNGLGLGLSICRSIIEAHGGQLSASGNADQGATFQFSLPLREESN